MNAWHAGTLRTKLGSHAAVPRRAARGQERAALSAVLGVSARADRRQLRRSTLPARQGGPAEKWRSARSRPALHPRVPVLFHPVLGDDILQYRAGGSRAAPLRWAAGNGGRWVAPCVV